jgi:hypothetical protein
VRGILVNDLQKPHRDAIEIRQNVIVPEAHNGETLTPEPVVTRDIRRFS